MASTSTNSSFPIPLVCPSCGAVLKQDAACGCPAKTRLELWNGIPRILFGQKYWGEISSEKMDEILRRMDTAHWERALEEIVPDEAVRAHLTSAIGPDFVHAMPWDEIETILDVGSGMGFMTSVLAPRAKTVIGLEAVAERALFQRKRAAQDGFPNWRPLIASASALPFAAGTFDLITLNGVFEYIGLWGEGDPEALQRKFLAEALRLLKPGGYLYVGIETRFALNMILGGRDHSGLAFTSLMPRRLADWYCRRRAESFYGSEHAIEGYRTYTYTPEQYRRMFADAGFGGVELFGVFDGYNRQKAVYRMDDLGPRRFARELVNPPASWKGRLLRGFANAGPWSRLLEDEVVVFGRKTAKDGRLAWSGLEFGGPLAQFSSSDKVFVVGFDGAPTEVFKAAKTTEAALLLEKEYAFLDAATRRTGAAGSSAVRWTKPLGVQDRHGRRFYRYEFAPGEPLIGELLPVSHDAARFARLIPRLVDGYLELCARLTAGAAPADAAARERFFARLAETPVGDDAAAARIRAAGARLRAKNWPLSAVHGDLSLGNSMLAPDGSFVLVDWENAASEGVVALDLIRLLGDVVDESRLLGDDARRGALAAARAAVRGALLRLGVGPEDFADLEAMYVADQFRMWLSRDAGAVASPRARALLAAWRAGEFAVDVSSAPRETSARER